jgi:hypothetical protein
MKHGFLKRIDALLSQRRKGRQGRQKLETGDLKTKLEIRKTENRPDPQMNADNLFRLFCHRGTETQRRLKTIAFFSVPLCLCGKPSAFLGGLGGFARDEFSSQGKIHWSELTFAATGVRRPAWAG